MGDNRNRSSIIFGTILVLLGLFFLFSQIVNVVFRIRIGQYTWPFAVLLPGFILYVLAFLTDQRTGRALIVPGSIVSAVGLLLLFQNLTDLWATWAYAWAFVFPTSVGLGQVIYGLLRGQKHLIREGWSLARAGGIILLVGFTFFELLIGVSGFGFFGYRSFCFPLVLIFGGLLFILFSFRSSRRSPQPTVEAVEPPEQQPTNAEEYEDQS